MVWATPLGSILCELPLEMGLFPEHWSVPATSNLQPSRKHMVFCLVQNVFPTLPLCCCCRSMNLQSTGRNICSLWLQQCTSEILESIVGWLWGAQMCKDSWQYSLSVTEWVTRFSFSFGGCLVCWNWSIVSFGQSDVGIVNWTLVVCWSSMLPLLLTCISSPSLVS